MDFRQVTTGPAREAFLPVLVKVQEYLHQTTSEMGFA